VLGRREYLKSLGTKDPAEAKTRFAAAFAESETVFGRARAGIAELDRKRLSPLPLSQKVCWFERRYPNINVAHIAAAFGISEIVVHKYRRRLRRQRRFRKDRSTTPMTLNALSVAGEAERMFALHDIEAGVHS